VLQVPYPVVSQWCAMIPNNPAAPVSLSQAMEMEPLNMEIAKADANVKRMFEIALKLEGLFRHVSKHAAGVVISRDQKIHEMVPVFRDDNGTVVTQFDMKGVEDAGLVKFDFLGLKTLDVIDEAKRLIRATGVDVDFDKIGVEDEATYEMLAKADSFGVFQLESSGMRTAMRQIQPSNIEDIIALVSLYRPGPMANIPVYADVKHGREDAVYQHPLMKKVLEPTNGVIIYQEQVMELARHLSGYTLGQADLLRRAMGKKIKSEMDAQLDVFVKGAAAGHIEIVLDDGRTIQVHAETKFRVEEIAEKVTAAVAMEKGYSLIL
jgi:DNA polymerase III subunit alpha